MHIAIIGYGSLIWDLENLTPFVNSEWKLGAGPAMPVEFSRISPKRKKALVLVIDQNLDHQCKTSVIDSNRNNIEQAVMDLAARERCEPEMIGFVSTCGKSHKLLDCATDWLAQSGYDAVMWTALPGNFATELDGQSFSHKNGREYLQSLDSKALKEAWRYIEFAPQVTDTPFRRYLASDPFWQSLDYREVVT